MASPCSVTRSTNTRAASHLVQDRENAEWDVPHSLAEHGQDDGTDQLFRQHRGLMSHGAFGGPSEEDELFARTTPGTDNNGFSIPLSLSSLKLTRVCQQTVSW